MDFNALTMYDVEILNEISQASSIRKVATRRNIAQPALSRKVQALESCLGAQIFIRHQKGVETTIFGKQCLSLLAQWRSEGLSTSRKIAESIDNRITIRLGTYDSVAIYFFPRLLKMVGATHLNCELEVHLNRSREIMREVSEGNLDVGLVFSNGTNPLGLTMKRVSMDEYGFFESTSHRSSHDFYTLVNSEDEEGHSIEEFLKIYRLDHHRLIDSPSFEMAAALTVAGLGIGILPIRVASTYVKQRKLKQLELAGIKTFGRHYLNVIRRSTNPDKTVDKLVELIEAGFTE